MTKLYNLVLFRYVKNPDEVATVIEVNEAYTSKTVSWTGEIVKNLGGRKWIKSPGTGELMDRDINGARGIMLRALVDLPSLFKTAIVDDGNIC
jgi:transposase